MLSPLEVYISYLGLNTSIGTDVEAMEDDVEVAGGGGHQQQQEVVVGVGEQPLLVDLVQQGLLPQGKLVRALQELRVDLLGLDLLVGGLADHHVGGQAAPRGHRVVEVPCAHHGCLLTWGKKVNINFFYEDRNASRPDSEMTL